MNDFPTLAFKNLNDWTKWLDENHTKVQGIWLKFYKKHSGVATVSYVEAVEAALCYGWIDSQVKSLDQDAYLQKFTPRREKSIWSKINTQRIEALIKEGRMQPAGLIQVENAKSDGRWAAAYDSPTTTEIPKDFLTELAKNSKAKLFFATLTKSNIYAITWRLQTAKKAETRQKRMMQIIEMLAKHEKFH